MDPRPKPPPPDQGFRPSKMADLATGLENMIRKIEKWGITVPGSIRLRNAVELLREVASARSFGESQEDLRKIGYAASDAREFAIIEGMLPSDRLDATATILTRAIGGTLGVTPHEAYQAQSELWVGAALSCADVPLGVLANPEGANPDYIVENGTLEYAIEVKRISGSGSVRRRVSEAARQTGNQRYHGGALYVDLTDWLPPEVTFSLTSGQPDLDSPRILITRRIDQLRKEVFDDYTGRIRPRRMHLFAVTAFARFIHWDLDDLSEMHVTRYITPLWFWRSAKNLRYHRARWLAELLQSGAGNIGLHLGGHEIIFENPVR